jgi:hypothetical protein
MRKPSAVVAGLLCVALLGACGGDDSGEPGSDTTEAKGPTAPLTGLPLDDDEVRERPLLTVKVDNHPDARPQFGIDKADVIVEEKVEGGLSRFMALFHSQDSDQVGPVRSLRSTDPRWLQPLGGMIGYSGGIAPVKSQLADNDIVDLGADSHGPRYYPRRSDRPFEHSMYTNTDILRELTPEGTEGPEPLFEYLDEGETFGGTTAQPTQGGSFAMSGLPTATSFDWTWSPDEGMFMRGTDGAAHSIENVGQIGMRNVIVQFTPYSPTPWTDAVGSTVDEADVTGQGDAWIFSDGKAVRGRWERSSGGSVTTYTDSAGNPVELQPGKTWLSLVPPGERAEVR